MKSLLPSVLAGAGAVLCALPATLQAQSWDFEIREDDYSDNAILDLRYLNEDRAGDRGQMYAENGKLYYGDGTEARIWGINAGAGTYEEILDRARFLAKRGVNANRYHVEKRVNDFDSSDFGAVDADILDQIHRSVAAYAEEGIYTDVSWYFPLAISMQAKWGIDGYTQEWISQRGANDQDTHPFFIFFFDDEARDAYKSWLRGVFGSENPYTGMTLAEDPAVCMIELINEDNVFFFTFTPNNVPPEQWDKVEEKFYEWVIEEYGDLDSAEAAWGSSYDPGTFDDNPGEGRLEVIPASFNSSPQGALRIADQLEFLADTQREFWLEMSDILRSELDSDALIIGTNWQTSNASYQFDLEDWTHTAVDVIDRHSYYNQSASGPVPGNISYYPMTATKNARRTPTAKKQVEGMPTITSESTWVNGNDWRGEAPLWLATFQSVSGYDGYFWFAGVDRANYATTMRQWPSMSPILAGQYPGAALMYRRGDLSESGAVVVEGRTLESLLSKETWLISNEGNYWGEDASEFNNTASAGPGDIDPLSMMAGPVLTRFGTDNDWVAPNLSELINYEDRTVTSQTQQVKLNLETGFFQFDSPLSQGGGGFFNNYGELELSDVDIDITTNFATIIVTSLDGQPISQSSRILVQNATEEYLTDFERSSSQRTVDGRQVTGWQIESIGRQPWTMNQLNGTVTLYIDRDVDEAITLDEYGYVSGRANGTERASDYRLDLPQDALYTVITFDEPDNYEPVVTSRSLPNADKNTAYEAQLKAISGDGDLSWSASNLPAGLSVSADGMVSGTPTEAGYFQVSATVEDDDGDTGEATVYLYVMGEVEGGDCETLWPESEFPLNSGFKETNALGWIWDEMYPWLYSYKFSTEGSWLYVWCDNAELNGTGMFVYRFAEDTWIWTVENYGGWYYDYDSNSWVRPDAE